jgi:hypothetical protein
VSDHFLKQALSSAWRAIAGALVSPWEQRRLRGQQVFRGAFSLIGLKQLLRLYPISFRGSYLVATYLREKTCSESELLLASRLYEGNSNKSSGHESLRQAIAFRLIRQQNSHSTEEILDNLRAKLFEITPIAEVDGITRIQHFAPYELKVNRFNVIHQDQPYPHATLETYPVAAGEVVWLEDAAGTIDSDLMESNGQSFVDLNSWPGAEHHNLVNDSRLLATNLDNRIGVQSSSSDSELTYEKAAWLGSPMLASWGHFVYEGLARLELLCREKSLDDAPFLVSSQIPSSFLEVAKTIFPTVSFVRIPPGTVCRVKLLALAPLRTFTPHNLHFSLEGESQRLNGEPELFNALRGRVRGIASFPGGLNGRRIFIDRQFANYRQTRNTARMREIAKRNGFEIVDPGSLGSLEQLQLFLESQTIWGQTGSGFFLAPLVGHGARVMMVGSDFSHDWEGLAHCISDSTGRPVDLITGKRDFIRKGFSEGLYHQDFKLSDSAWGKIETWCSLN